MNKKRTLNEYIIRAMITNCILINCEIYCKDELIEIIRIYQEEYKKILEKLEERL